MPKALVVQHERSVPPGSISDVLREEGLEQQVLRAWEENTWPSIDDIDALIVMGGTMNVDQLDAYPFLKRSRELMVSAVDRGVPTLGVCLGAQMMARALDAPVRRAAKRNASFSPLVLTDDGHKDEVIEPFGSELPVLQFHEDTFEIPVGGIALASSAQSGTAQAFRVGDNAYAIQFHFEVDEMILKGWCDDIGEPGMIDEWGVSTDDLLAAASQAIPKQWEAGKDLTRRFLRHVRNG